ATGDRAEAPCPNAGSDAADRITISVMRVLIRCGSVARDGTIRHREMDGSGVDAAATPDVARVTAAVRGNGTVGDGEVSASGVDAPAGGIAAKCAVAGDAAGGDGEAGEHSMDAPTSRSFPPSCDDQPIETRPFEPVPSSPALDGKDTTVLMRVERDVRS